MNNFKLCAFTDEAGNSLEEQILAMKQNNIHYMEIRGVNGKNISTLTADQVKQVYSRLQSEGLEVWSIGSPIGKIGIKDNFQEHLDLFSHMLELAYILSAKSFRLFSFYIPKEERHEDYKDEVLERMSRFCEIAEGSDITLCHENEKGIYGDKPERCLDIHKALPKIRAIFDPANFVQCQVETYSAFKLMAPYIHYMHIKDAKLDGNVVPSGMGDGKIPQLLSLYKEIGGNILSVEPHLTIFNGLKELEKEETSKVGVSVYPTQRLAFDAAVNALKRIII